MTCQELITTEAKLIGNLVRRVHRGGRNSPSQSIYTYNCMTRHKETIGKRRQNVCRLVITCHFYTV